MKSNLVKASAFRFFVVACVAMMAVACGSKSSQDATTQTQTPTVSLAPPALPTPSSSTDLTSTDTTTAGTTANTLTDSMYSCASTGQISSVNDLLNRAAYHYVRGVYRDGSKQSSSRGISGRSIGNPFASRGLKSARGMCGGVDTAAYDLGGLASNGGYGVGDLATFLFQILQWIFQSFRGNYGWQQGSFYGYHPQLFSPYQSTLGYVGDGLLPFNHAWYAGQDYRPRW